jgi:hypothetical protein
LSDWNAQEENRRRIRGTCIFSTKANSSSVSKRPIDFSADWRSVANVAPLAIC